MVLDYARNERIPTYKDSINYRHFPTSGDTKKRGLVHAGLHFTVIKLLAKCTCATGIEERLASAFSIKRLGLHLGRPTGLRSVSTIRL